MGLFRSNSVSSASSTKSAKSDRSSSSISSAASSASKKVKASDLNFQNTASPNSRLMTLSPEGSAVPLARARSISSSSSTKGPAQVAPRPVERQQSSNGTNGAAIAKEAKAPTPKVTAPKPAAASSESEESEESEEDVSEDEKPVPKKLAPIVAQRASTAEAKAAAARVKKAAPVTKAPVVAAARRTASPVSIESESESESEESASESDESESDESEDARPAKKGVKKPVRKLSRAAALAAHAMDAPYEARQRKGKPLANLTYDDVKVTEDELREDIAVIWKAMHLFMNSRMVEAEEICTSGADHRLYYSVGYSLIQTIKSLATFEPDDLEAAIQCCKDSITITSLLRKKDHSLFESSIRLAKGSTSASSIKSMTVVQRHAELIWAECTLLKAVLGIIYSGDFIAFLKEALNMRAATAVYKTLAKYVEVADQEYGGEDPKLDQDFRSGVFLGNGLIAVILSLLPSAVLKIMEIFGFNGDLQYGLTTLMKGGKWIAGAPDPGMDVEKEGIRRQVCDMVLLTYHLVIASYLPVSGVDVVTAANVLHFNLDRYPNGVFFLYFAGRLHSTQTQLELAVDAFHKAIKAQREYVQLGHICYWDLGLVSVAMGNHQKGYECFNILDKESNWSKAIYAYGKGTMLYEMDGKDKSQANAIMKSVPDLMQRIAGKSIPLEKFVARRARKFVHQGNRLCLPGVELAYVLNCLGMTPRFVLFETHLDQVSCVLSDLLEVKDKAAYGRGDEYWDDFCLAHLLRGIILRFIAHPESYTKPRPAKPQIPVKEADDQAMVSFNEILKHATDICHDQHLVWFAHYELGRLYEAKSEFAKAREQYELVMSGKMEGGKGKGKGKVSLQNMAVLRSNSALQTLKGKF